LDYKKIGKRSGRKAVSPVVATLILIIVAIVGAVAVGLIVSGIGNSTQKNANAGGAASNSQTQLFIGCSTTIYPVEVASQVPFQTATGVQLNLAQGGSDAGMQGVLSGALDIGAASSAKSVNALENAVVSQSLTGVTVNAVLIGGSGVVVGTTSTANGGAGAPAANFLTDGANKCFEITRAALAQMYVDGVFYIQTGGCGGTGTAATASAVLNVLGAACVSATAVAAGGAACATPTVTTTTGPYQTVSRSDQGGTEDAFGSYITTQGTPALNYVSGSGVLGASSNTGSGNLGVLTVTQKCAFPNAGGAGVAAVGCVGFFDLGFAEGASQQAAATCPGNGGNTPCGVAIPELSSPADAGAPDAVVAGTSATVANSYIAPLASTTGLHSFIKSALTAEAKVNPLTLVGATSVYPDATAPVNSLTRTFYLVTNGSPTVNEQKYITFVTSPNAEAYFSAQGYFTQYDFTAA